ncbi:hypothetical protein Tco_1034002 [Tanacetum coccineum]
MIVSSSPPTIMLSDKLMTMTNITTLVLIKLDINEMNYSSWIYFFKYHCRGFELLEHLSGTPTDEVASSNPVPPTSEWLKIDSIILSWIFTTMSKAQLRSLKLGDLTIDAYFHKIESIATILASLGSSISKDDIVYIALDGFPDKYEHVSDIIIHREPFPDLKKVRSMLTMTEMRLKSRAQATSIDSSSSSPMVLLANSGNNNTRHSTAASGHSVLPTLHRPLHLNNVLITHNIVKNLIYGRQFVRDNYCTVEFDAFGFSVKDFLTRRVLIRCDSTGDLYPVIKPFSIPHAFLTSQYTWHQRLGHPGSKVLCRVLSSNSISCNKEKPHIICQDC